MADDIRSLRESDISKYPRMHSNNEDQCSQVQLDKISPELQKQSKISYSRDFLLSISELEICKKLPSGLDRSILSDLVDSSHSISERQRIPGSLSFQSSRRSEYGSSPPTKGDSSHYSRGVHGKWDSRSDRDNDSQLDRDSDSGRCYGSVLPRSSQNSEHDGLLGSGAFPRPSGYPAGALAPKVRGNGHYQLNRSNEPYHPPRPYKAVRHSRREDLFNDETFGSDECSSQDRAEEERKRRDSFELMRKEQQKAFQEKQKQFPDKHRGKFKSDIAALLADSEDITRVLNKNNECVIPPTSHSDSNSGSFPTETMASRPLVPPGFAGTIQEKNIEKKSLIHPPVSEVGNVGIEDDIMHAKANPIANATYDNQEEKQTRQHMDSREQQHGNKDIHLPFTNEDEKLRISFSVGEGSGNSVVSYKTPNLLESFEDPVDGEFIDFEAEKVTGHKVIGTSDPDNSTSILEKLFGSALTDNSGGSSSSIMQHDVNADTWSPTPVQSSKFAHWFLDEEKKPVDDLSSDKPRDLLSLIVGSEKGGTQLIGVSDDVANEHILPNYPLESNELNNRFMASTTSAAGGISEQLYNSNKLDTTPGILTCEDLEQSILSEIKEHNTNLQHSVQSWSASDATGNQPKPDVDDPASQHLFSLLQKGTSLKDPEQSPNPDVGSSDRHHVFDVGSVSTVLNCSSKGNAEKVDSGRSLTLETLFGTAFMKELQSFEAPVSVQRGSLGGTTRADAVEPHGFPFPVADDGFFPSTVGEYGSDRINHEHNVLAMNHMQQTKFEHLEGHWLGSDPQNEATSNVNARGFDDRTGGAVEIHLPEEDSLITIGDPVRPTTLNSNFMPTENAIRAELLSSNTPVDIAEKLAALKAVFNDEISMVPGLEGSPFVHGPYDPIESDVPYKHFHAQPSSPQFHHPQMNHGRPVFHPLDSQHAHMNSQIKFMGPKGIIHHDPPLHHHFPVDMFRSPFQQNLPVPTRFDTPSTHHSVLQQMHMAGNFPHPHLLQGLPRGGPLPPHSISHVPGYISEPNPMQCFPLTHRQPNYGGHGMPMPASGPGGGGNHPEMLERLIEMELRANSKQVHPLAAAGRSPGMYSHELDMGFRYR